MWLLGSCGCHLCRRGGGRYGGAGDVGGGGGGPGVGRRDVVPARETRAAREHALGQVSGVRSIG